MIIVTKAELSSDQLKTQAEAMSTALQASGMAKGDADKQAVKETAKHKNVYTTFDSSKDDKGTVEAFRNVMVSLQADITASLPIVGMIAATGNLPADKAELDKTIVKFTVQSKKTAKTEADKKKAAEVSYSDKRLDGVTAGEFASSLFRYALNGKLTKQEVFDFSDVLWEYFACQKVIALSDRLTQATADYAAAYSAFASNPRTAKYVTQHAPNRVV